jgi:predicted nucleotidyltransferase
MRVEELSADLHLTRRERRVVERLLVWLRGTLADDLLAVWLFGSRARGEVDLEEVDPDLRSDVDLMVIVGPGRDTGRLHRELAPHLERIADGEGDSPVWYSVLAYDIDRLRERRRVNSFFVQEVDRDKIVLFGDALDPTKPS